MPDLTPFFASWLARTRANQLWFHGAHHLTSGPSFLADHAFYGEVYAAYEDNYDALAEKAIALGLAKVVNPMDVVRAAGTFLAKMPPLAGQGGAQIAASALEVERAWLATLQNDVTLTTAEAPIGLDNLLRSIADAHDVFAYKLVQRTISA